MRIVKYGTSCTAVSIYQINNRGEPSQPRLGLAVYLMFLRYTYTVLPVAKSTAIAPYCVE